MKTVYDVLIEKLEEAKTDSMQFLVDGGVKDFAEYKSLCGEIRGLSAAQEEIKDLVRKLKEEDDD